MKSKEILAVCLAAIFLAGCSVTERTEVLERQVAIHGELFGLIAGSLKELQDKGYLSKPGESKSEKEFKDKKK